MPATGQRRQFAGNFDMGTFFGDVTCRRGHETRLFNIGRDHYVACDRCRRYVHVGSNLMSSWRRENERVWRRNHASIRGYALVRWQRRRSVAALAADVHQVALELHLG